MNHPFLFMSRLLSHPPMRRNRKEMLQITENKDKYIACVFIPGRSIDQIKIELQGHLLLVEALDAEVSPPEDATLFWQEFSLSVPSYTFRIPRDVELDLIEAKVNNGNLTISLPKREPITRSIPISAKTA